MYKVFVNDCPIILTENKNISTNLLKVNFQSCCIHTIIHRLFKKEMDGICLICNDLKFCWKQFKKHFKIEKAAGGKVFNNNQEVLFIYRFQKWDLPKGKLEKGESKKEAALREVQEECGLNELNILEKLPTTYHIFQRNEKIILKITYWYLMSTKYSGLLTPQTKEGIEQAVFKNEMAVKEAILNTYENIKLLF